MLEHLNKKSSSIARTAAAFSVVLALLLASSVARANGVPLAHSGRITDKVGKPMAGPADIVARFFNAEQQGQQLGPDFAFPKQSLSNGVFHLIMNIEAPLAAGIFNSFDSTVYIEIEANGRVFPRQRYFSIPLAQRVGTDDRTVAFDGAGLLRVGPDSQPGANQFLTKDSAGNLVWGTPAQAGVLASLHSDGHDGMNSSQIHVGASSSAAPALVVAGSPSQGADLEQWRDSTGASTAAIDANGYLKLKDADGNSNYVALRASSAMPANLTYTFPGSIIAGDFLTTDASGLLSWTGPGPFTGAFAGEISGGQGSTVVNTVGGSTSAQVHTAELTANASTAANSPLTIAKRDSFGGLSSGQLLTVSPLAATPGLIVGGASGQAANLQEWRNSGGTTLSAVSSSGALVLKDNDGSDNFLTLSASPTMATDLTYTFPGTATAGAYLTTNSSGSLTWASPGNFSGSLSGDVTGTQNSTVITTVGGVSSTAIGTATALIQASDSANTPSTLVQRDGSGNFSAGTITANLSGTAGNITGIVTPAHGGTGVANNGASTETIVGNYPLSLTLSAATGVTLPTAGTLSTLAGSETWTTKTLTSPVIGAIVHSGTLTLPTSSDTLIGRATSDTLTNKTLTLPVISAISNTGTLTLPTASDRLIGRATTDTLTNKTLTSPAISGGTLGVTSAIAVTSAITTTGSLGAGTASASGGALMVGGRFGMGTTAPGSALQVEATSPLVEATGVEDEVIIHRNGTASVSGDGAAVLSVGQYRANFTDTNLRLDFKLNGTTSGSTANHIVTTLQQNGNVGIGTTAPTATLQVVGTATATGVSTAAFNGMYVRAYYWNNGTVPCDTFCTAGYNSPGGICVAAKRGDNGVYVSCGSVQGGLGGNALVCGCLTAN